MNIYRHRAENMIRALRESPDPSQFTMHCFHRLCGTPACVLGHYAAREDLQDVVRLDRKNHNAPIRLRSTGVNAIPAPYATELLEHLGMTQLEAYAMFSVSGCDRAKTAEQAIAYIERFIAKKWPEEAPARKLIDELNRLEGPKVPEIA